MYSSKGFRKASIMARCRDIAALALALYATSAGHSIAYDRMDAGYVTHSRNKAVLDYIVCLEGVVAGTPKKMTIEASLDRAEAKCKAKAAKLPRSSKEPDAGEIRLMIMECGFRLGEASPDVGCGVVVEDEKQAPVVAVEPAIVPNTNGRYSLSEVEQAAIVKGVQARLKDPMSAVFGGAVATRDPKGFVYVCGSVNAKNSYGGYTGHQPYSGMLIGNGQKVFFAVLGIAGDDAEQRAILSVCRERGLL